jgi:hypothetical protein
MDPRRAFALKKVVKNPATACGPEKAGAILRTASAPVDESLPQRGVVRFPTCGK